MKSLVSVTRMLSVSSIQALNGMGVNSKGSPKKFLVGGLSPVANPRQGLDRSPLGKAPPRPADAAAGAATTSVLVLASVEAGRLHDEAEEEEGREVGEVDRREEGVMAVQVRRPALPPAVRSINICALCLEVNECVV